MSRIKDERLARIERINRVKPPEWIPLIDELLQALKAEREEVEYMQSEKAAIARIRDKKATKASRRIDELKAAYEHTVEDNEDLVRMLDAVNKVIVEADTFALNLSLPQAIRRLKTALKQENEDG